MGLAVMADGCTSRRRSTSLLTVAFLQQPSDASHVLLCELALSGLPLMLRRRAVLFYGV
jgi:hypothetical protein